MVLALFGWRARQRGIRRPCTLRYDASIHHPHTRRATPSAMICLGRFLIVLSLALLAMQGAFAHEHVMPMQGKGVAMQMAGVASNRDALLHSAPSLSFHCETAVAGEPPRGRDHGHCACCMSACGVHCGAVLTTARFEPRSLDTTLPPPFAEPRRDGVTHAPPVPPPIG